MLKSNSKYIFIFTIIAVFTIILSCVAPQPPSRETMDTAEKMIFDEINLDRRLNDIHGLERSPRLDSVAKDLALDMLSINYADDPLALSLDKRELQSVMSVAQIGVVYEKIPLEAGLYRDLFYEDMCLEDTNIFRDKIYSSGGISVIFDNNAVSAFVVLAQLADTTADGEAVPTLAGKLWPSDSLISREELLFELVNDERSSAGRRKLVLDPHLRALARIYAEKMLKTGFFDHNEPSGKGLRERVISSNMEKYSIWGENLASLLNPTDPAVEAHEGLMDSPGHRQNIMASDYTHIGIGAATDGSWWIFVQLFAKD